MRSMLVNDIPWGETDKSLPMVKEIEALERLPGDYIITESSTEYTKAEVLNQQETEAAERLKKESSLKKGGKVSISRRWVETLLFCGTYVGPQN